VRHNKIDLLHSHCESSSFYSGLIGTLLRIPTVATIHRSELRFYAPTWRNRLYYRFVNFFITVSDDRRSRLTGQLSLPENRVQTIHWGIGKASRPEDLGTLAYRKKLGLNDGQILLSLGHLGPIKGHEDSIRAMALIKPEFPNCRLYIAGDGEITDHERLHELIESLNLQGDVILLGQITNALDWMMACDIFLQPSREEAFGLVFLEAGLCRKPTVATRVGGIPEIIEDGVNGYLVQPNAPDQLADRILQLLSSKEKMDTMGESASDIVSQRFDLETQVAALEQFFTSVIKQRRN